MSAASFDNTAPDEGFVLRGPELAEAQEHFTATRSEERWRKIRNLVTVGGGWVFGICMTPIAIASLAVVIHRPVPRDHLAVTLLHDNGVSEVTLREDLPQDRLDMLMRWTTQKYVTARESYLWEGLRAEYNLVSSLSAPQEQAAYQAMMGNKSDPQNPMKLYGQGVGAGKASVLGVEVEKTDPASPNVIHAMVLIGVLKSTGQTCKQTKLAEMSWMPAADIVPLDVQQRDDPAAILYTHYSSQVVSEVCK